MWPSKSILVAGLRCGIVSRLQLSEFSSWGVGILLCVFNISAFGCKIVGVSICNELNPSNVGVVVDNLLEGESVAEVLGSKETCTGERIAFGKPLVLRDGGVVRGVVWVVFPGF